MKSTVYLPDELAAEVKRHPDFNLSGFLQAALRSEFDRREAENKYPVNRVARVCEDVGPVRDGEVWRDEHVRVTAVTTSCRPIGPGDTDDTVGICVSDATSQRREDLSKLASEKLLRAAIADIRSES